MSFLINRNPPARLECLHALCKLINLKYSINTSFKMTDIKFDPKSINIHSQCELLLENKSLGLKYCRYKENPLNNSGCSLTNGINDDTTKSKEVSNTINSLHALGFVNRIGNSIKFTNEGKRFAETLYNSNEMLIQIRTAVLRYGLFVGFIYQIKNLGKNEFDTNEIDVGYPKATENILYNGELIKISSGSEDDSITRTKSCLIAWATTCGFICPLPILSKLDMNNPHISSSEYVLQPKRNLRKYKIINLPQNLFSGDFVTKKPLDYKNLTKNIGALRENNQQNIREITLKLEPKIQNRRLAVLYILNKAFRNKKDVQLQKLVDFLLTFKEYFVIEKENFYDVMCEEINIAFISGIPFLINGKDNLKPLTGLNTEELTLNAPKEVIAILNKFEL